MPPPSPTRLPFLHEDRWLLAVNKPAGVLSHPNPAFAPESRPMVPCAFEGAYDSKQRRFDTPAGPLWLLHRLDQETSGALLAARDPATAEALRNLFEKASIRKTYLALISGQSTPPSGAWRDHLEKERSRDRVRSVIRPHRVPNAELRYITRENFPRLRLSLIEITLLTGRTHQIRVQAAARRHPVAGDRIYGDFRLNRELRQAISLRRLFLHAWRLQFTHPATRKPVTVEAPLPRELEECLQGAHAR